MTITVEKDLPATSTPESVAQVQLLTTTAPAKHASNALQALNVRALTSLTVPMQTHVLVVQIIMTVRA